MAPKGLFLLLWVFFIHLTGIYLFTRGFLLTRLSLSESSVCSGHECSLIPTHKRAVVLIIDALRFDFLASEPPKPISPFYHNILTLPQQLTASHPRHSFLFNAYADPPTTTLQRIKGLTTGSLPTFVDLGNNFGASSIAEDSILNQLHIAGKKVAFMGDDTWMSVFSELIHPNMSFPYESFNVEDLHTVDEGVIANIFPLLEDKSRPFDFLIGHFLGVDHVGHRVGPDHPSMKAKLQQMNEVLSRVVKLLDDETLLVVLGDHGMDRTGDHGGDGDLETSSALWIYSKGPPLSQTLHSIPIPLLPQVIFPGASSAHRSVQQIDILSTISLLLGLPIPYNNLGTVIPELFWRDRKGSELLRAMELNAAQIRKYLDTYRVSASGGELDDAWSDLQSTWTATQAIRSTASDKMVALYKYNRFALETCRSLWAQFIPILMGLGLALLMIGVIATWAIYCSLLEAENDWDTWLSINLPRSLRGSAGGIILGFLASFPLQSYIPGIDALDYILFSAAFFSSVIFIISSKPTFSVKHLKSVPIPLILHSLAFLSNSFTFWEDRIIPYLILTSMIPTALTGLTAPTSRLRKRILGFSLLFALCVRLISTSTVCREEQQPYCHVTFYASSSPSPPFVVLVLAGPTSLALPWILQWFLRISKSDRGIAKTFLPWIVRLALLAGTGYWFVEWADSVGLFGDEWSPLLRVGRTALVRLAFGCGLIAGTTHWWLGTVFWWSEHLCLDIKVETTQGNKRIKVIGYANTFGSPYLLFWCIFLSAIYATTQLTGQLVLALVAVALMAYLEIIDSVRDVRSLEAAFASSTPSTALNYDANNSSSPQIRFSDIIPVALLGLHAFYGTGHQSTIPSIQWKSGFLLTPTLTYPFSPITVVLNTAGPLFLAGLASPLLALWNRAPRALTPNKAPQERPDVQVQGESTIAALGIMVYYACLLLGTATSAAVLRRHLMVWKVFAPRFMAAVIEVVAVDVAVLIGIGIGVGRIGKRVNSLFGVAPART